jgi:hypothetical protein
MACNILPLVSFDLIFHSQFFIIILQHWTLIFQAYSFLRAFALTIPFPTVAHSAQVLAQILLRTSQ